MKTRFQFISILTVASLVLAISCTPARPARGYIYNDQQPDKGFGAYAYVLLSSGSVTGTGAKYERLVHTANSFLENFPKPGERVSADQKHKLMVTHWMLNNRNLPEETGKALVDHYNYSRSLQMLQALNMSGKPGPILVAWTKPYEELTEKEIKKSLVFDLSRFSDEDIDRAFRLWRKMLTEDVHDWNKPGNKLIKFREEVRNGFQQYGQTLFDLISIIY